MADDLNEYYRRYYKIYGACSYTMEGSGLTSRVMQLIDWLRMYTKPKARILDIGCGDGYLSTLLPDREWVGIDINTERAKCKAFTHDLMTQPYPFAAGSFDAIICSEVLEHLFDLRVVHQEARRLVRASGHYIISTPNFDYLDHFLGEFKQLLFDPMHPHLFEHIRQYNFQTHEQFLHGAGFNVIDRTGADGHYSGIFNTAEIALKAYLEEKFQYKATSGEVHQVIGRQFPLLNHTIMMVAKPF